MVLAMDGTQNSGKLVTASYICPRCYTRCIELPTQCSVCRLQLSSSTHLARSYHHLFPVPNYTEVTVYSVNDILYYKLPHSERASIHDKSVHIHDTSDDVYMNTTINNSSVEVIKHTGDATGEASSTTTTPTRLLLPKSCAGCMHMFTIQSTVLICENCKHMFCTDCDLYIHDSLHNCPCC